MNWLRRILLATLLAYSRFLLTAETVSMPLIPYEVRSGDSISLIARRNQLSIEQLIELNRFAPQPLHPKKPLQIGQTLYLPNKFATPLPNLNPDLNTTTDPFAKTLLEEAKRIGAQFSNQESSTLKSFDELLGDEKIHWRNRSLELVDKEVNRTLTQWTQGYAEIDSSLSAEHFSLDTAIPLYGSERNQLQFLSGVTLKEQENTLVSPVTLGLEDKQSFDNYLLSYNFGYQQESKKQQIRTTPLVGQLKSEPQSIQFKGSIDLEESEEQRQYLQIELGKRSPSDHIYHAFYDYEQSNRSYRFGFLFEAAQLLTLDMRYYSKLKEWRPYSLSQYGIDGSAQGFDLSGKVIFPRYQQLGTTMRLEHFYEDSNDLFSLAQARTYSTPMLGLNWQPYPTLTLEAGQQWRNWSSTDMNAHLNLQWQPPTTLWHPPQAIPATGAQH